MRDSGAATAAQWLVATGGGSARKARRTAGRASRLKQLPATARALSEGELTAEHVDVIIGAVRRGRLGTPAETEQALLETATRTTPEELRRQVKTREEAVKEESLLDENAAYARRRCLGGNDRGRHLPPGGGAGSRQQRQAGHGPAGLHPAG